MRTASGAWVRMKSRPTFSRKKRVEPQECEACFRWIYALALDDEGVDWICPHCGHDNTPSLTLSVTVGCVRGA